MKIQNTFLQGKMNKDIDERLLPEGQYPHAENIRVANTEGSDIGAIENMLGNELIVVTELPNTVCIGSKGDESRGKVYYALTSDTDDYIGEYDVHTKTNSRLLQGDLNFNPNLLVDFIKINNEEEDKDLLVFNDALNQPKLININRVKTWGVGSFTEEDILLIKAPPRKEPDIAPFNQIGVEDEDFLKDKFVSFSYRYVYKDGERSALSPFSDIAFSPSSYDIDYANLDNLSMINVFNSVNVAMDTGNANVEKLELCYKETNKSEVYLVESFNKIKEGWIDNVEVSVVFSGKKSLTLLPSDEYTRLYDNVPLRATSMELIGSRLVFANYDEGYDLIDSVNNPIKISISLEKTTEEIDQVDEVVGEINNNKASVGLNAMPLSRGTRLDFNVALTQDFPKQRLTIGGASSYPTVEGLFNTPIINIRQSDLIGEEYIQMPVDSGNDTYTMDLELSIEVLEGSGEYDYQLIDEASEVVYSSGTGVTGNTNISLSDIGGATVNGSTKEFRPTILFTRKNTNLIKVDTKVKATQSHFVSGALNDIGLVYAVNNMVYNNFQKTYNSIVTVSLTKDYLDVAELVSDTALIATLERSLYSSFTSIADPFFYGSVTGVNTVSGLTVSVLNGDTFEITTPTISYEVDGGSDTHFEDMPWTFNSLSLTHTTSTYSKSVKTNRGYEACLVYYDKQGRHTTALTGVNNNLFIDQEDISSINKLRLNINHKPPSWSDRFKVGIKEAKAGYDVINANIIHEDGTYVWVKLEGQNIKKVVEGSSLIVKSTFAGFEEEVKRVEVLEVSHKEMNFLSNGKPQDAGTYMKIKVALGSDLDFDKGETVKTYSSGHKYKNNYTLDSNPSFEGVTLNDGAIVRIKIRFKRHSSTFKTGFEYNFDKSYIVDGADLTFEEYYNNVINVDEDWLEFKNNKMIAGEVGIFNNRLRVKCNTGGTTSRKVKSELDITLRLRKAANVGTDEEGVYSVVFETLPKDNPLDIFYLSPGTFDVVNGLHTANNQDQTNSLPAVIDLPYYNCYVQEKGVESYKIRDRVDGNYLKHDSRPISDTQDEYRRVSRLSDLTYSETYSSNTNSNGINEFNLSKANYKDDLDKKYGSIQEIHTMNNNLVCFQEHKVSRIMFGKDALFNTDGTSNVTSTSLVLGQHLPMEGEHGISRGRGSFSYNGDFLFFTDSDRGKVLAMKGNTIVDISAAGMSTFFRQLFRDNPNAVITATFDNYFDQYVLNVNKGNGEFVTLIYDQKVEGWTSFLSYSPESFSNVSNKLISFKNGNLYEHHSVTVPRNNFYGTQYESTIETIFNTEKSIIKSFKALSLEGNKAWSTEVKAFVDGKEEYLKSNIESSEYKQKEGVWNAYLRRDTTGNRTDAKDVYGVGVVESIEGLKLKVNTLNSSITIGDKILKGSDLSEVGTITMLESGYITLDSVEGLQEGDFLVGKKDSRVEGSSIRGYSMLVTLTDNSEDQTELFAVNAEVVKSSN